MDLKVSDSNISVEVTGGTLTPSSIWEEKDKWLAMENKSIKEWEAMDEDKKETIVLIVDRTLERLRDRIQDWLPYSLTLDEQGQYLDVTFRMLFSDLEREVATKIDISDRSIKQAASEAEALLREVRSRES